MEIKGVRPHFLTVEQIRGIDRKATEVYGIPSIILMENAGRIVAEETLKLSKSASAARKPVAAIICGSGNNAGDGFISAKYLYNWEAGVNVYLLKNYDDYKGDALTNLNTINKMGISIKTIVGAGMKTGIDKSDIIIDAVFGTGLKGEIKGVHKDIIELINSSNKPIVAVDIPSGLNGDTGVPSGTCVSANMTVSMGYSKKGFLNPESKKFTGEVVVADIGYPRDIVNSIKKCSARL